MECNKDSNIEIIGISEFFSCNSNTFKQLQLQEYVCIPEIKPEAEQILSISVKVEIDDKYIIKVPKGKSCEGQVLTGNKLFVKGKLIQKITYIAKDECQSVHTAHFNNPFINYIIMDENMECNYDVVVDAYIEDIYIKQIDGRKIFKNIMLLLNASVISNV